MQQATITQEQYLISCQKCQNCWIAGEHEANDTDMAYCPDCGTCNLRVSRYFEF